MRRYQILSDGERTILLDVDRRPSSLEWSFDQLLAQGLTPRSSVVEANSWKDARRILQLPTKEATS